MPTTRIVLAGTALLWAASASGQDSPLADHHQHLFSPALAALIAPAPPAAPTPAITATDLIAQLDAAGIKRAAVLSTAYIWEQPSRSVDNASGKVRADNDWTSQQVAQYPDRLIGFCGLNPLKDYALEELARCARDPNLRRGVKMHFGNSEVDYTNAQHIEQVRRVFRAANGYGHGDCRPHARVVFAEAALRTRRRARVPDRAGTGRTRCHDPGSASRGRRWSRRHARATGAGSVRRSDDEARSRRGTPLLRCHWDRIDREDSGGGYALRDAHPSAWHAADLVRIGRGVRRKPSASRRMGRFQNTSAHRRRVQDHRVERAPLYAVGTRDRNRQPHERHFSSAVGIALRQRPARPWALKSLPGSDRAALRRRRPERPRKPGSVADDRQTSHSTQSSPRARSNRRSAGRPTPGPVSRGPKGGPRLAA